LAGNIQGNTAAITHPKETGFSPASFIRVFSIGNYIMQTPVQSNSTQELQLLGLRGKIYW